MMAHIWRNIGAWRSLRGNSHLRPLASRRNMFIEVDEPFETDSENPDDITYPPLQGHNLFVCQPWLNWSNWIDFTSPQLQLAECVSLGNTVQGWRVVGSKIMYSSSTNRKQLVTKRDFDELQELIRSNPHITAIMFGVEVLSGMQLLTLEKQLGLPVYDRFTTVLNIFKQNARTKESKLQIALAELPYIRAHLREIHESSDNSSVSDSFQKLVGGAGESFYHRRREILGQRERRIRTMLEDLSDHRKRTKTARQKAKIPTVSIVGYTNGGKTSLIKALTREAELMPKNQLFATLDVTVHQGRLPSNDTVLFVDTVGFISRVPTLLIKAFEATLADVRSSHLIVHVMDVSHPDHQLQRETVLKALSSLEMPTQLINSMITVGNKFDLYDGERPLSELPKCDINISTLTGFNMADLIDFMDKRLTTNLGNLRLKIRVASGGDEYSWLRSKANMIEQEVDPDDGNYIICTVNMPQMMYGKYRTLYGTANIIGDVPDLSSKKKKNYRDE